MLQTLERCFDDETLADQPPQLSFDILYGGTEGLEGRELLLQSQPIAEDLPDQSTDFLRQQAKPWSCLGATRLETRRVGRPGVEQTGPRNGQIKQLPTQFVERA